MPALHVLRWAEGKGLRAITMFDVNDTANGGYRRVEVLTGPSRRRRWSADAKARIVEETLVPGSQLRIPVDREH
jgi:hypothetical protein